MPLTTEQIDAAKAELVYDSPRKIRVLGRDYMRQNDGAWNEYVRPSEDVRRGWGWLPLKDSTLAPAFDRALSRAHLAEARRLGVPAWTLEELEVIYRRLAERFVNDHEMKPYENTSQLRLNGLKFGFSEFLPESIIWEYRIEGC